jgi:hypothetical protein
VTDAAAAAWLEVLGALITNAAHASNNALNAAAVNLSVLASRLTSPKVAESSGTELAARTAGFAAQAAAGLDSVSELVQSMVGLARPLPVPGDPWRMVADIVRVVTADTRQGTSVWSVEISDPVLMPDAGPLVRLAIASGVVALHRAGHGGTVRWAGREVVLGWPDGSPGAPPAGTVVDTRPILADNILRIVSAAGFAVRVEAGSVTFSIPEVMVNA